jgi:predicted N-acetyltransferase YhbS
MNDVRIRPARPDEAAGLSLLCRRSKAHWGYDAAFLAASKQALAIEETTIAAGRVLVAEDDSGGPLGVAAVEPLDANSTFDLSHLFVEPRAIGRHVGSALFAAVVELVKRKRGTRLMILADPHAAAFYERVGAARVGDAPSDAIPGRHLPLFEYRIGTAAAGTTQ